ncbi:MAG: cupredoxin domain-containing protein [Wenzhouxiangellaceae bacterium]
MEAAIPESTPEPVAPPDPVPAPEAEETPKPEAAPASPPQARSNLTGRVALTGRDADVAETVLYFEPDAPIATPKPGRFEIATRDKTFEPAVMAVTRGSVVRFPNRDPILHNVFSVSSGNAFDLGVYGPDAAPETRLDQTGAVNVYCNVHHEMHAHVLVLETPWFVQVDADGGFALADLPPGPGTLHAWHRQADAWSMRIEGGAAAPIDVRLNIVRPQLPAHTDKRGQSYFRKDRDPYR